MGHIGVTPQTISMLGGLKAQGKDEKTAQKIIEDAFLLEEAGAFAIVLECVPALLSKMVTEHLNIPTISYGAGIYCDGQGLVSPDVLGLFDRFTPKFAKRYVNLSELVLKAFVSYKEEVLKGEFPTDRHSFHIDEQVLSKIKV